MRCIAVVVGALMVRESAVCAMVVQREVAGGSATSDSGDVVLLCAVGAPGAVAVALDDVESVVSDAGDAAAACCGP